MVSASERSTPRSGNGVIIEPPQLLTAQPSPVKLLGAPDLARSLKASPPASARAPVAVVVAHGMGQQVRFETLTTMATRLTQVAGGAAPLRTRLVEIEGQRLARVEVQVPTCNGPREVHLYETYWASLTEGEVTLRDVTRFLFVAGSNGVRKGITAFNRWLFGRYHELRVPIGTLVSLLVGLMLVLALMAINSAIAVVAAARLVVPGASWPSAGLIGDFSTVFNVLLVGAAALAAVLWVAQGARMRPARYAARTVLGIVSAVLMAVLVGAVIAAGLAIVALLALHQRAGTRPPLLREMLWPAIVDAFNGAVEVGVGIAVVALVLLFAVKFIVGLVDRRRSPLPSPPGSALSSRVVLASFAVLGVVLLAEAGVFLVSGWRTVPAAPESTPLLRTLAWLLLVAGAWVVRTALVEYVGDVAAYVQPYVLDRFNDLRTKIRETVSSTVAAVYRAAVGDTFQYESVILVGHSLGSVALYDALNQMLADDKLAATTPAGGSADTVKRTALFLTFGSPLDKTAFVFDSEPCAVETRAALAATSRPLIEDPAVRQFDWVNVYSPWDIISGSLDYYDPPSAPAVNGYKRVQNVRDADATTLLLAHVEYWESARLYDLVLARIA
jgi:hypothetical protein